MMLGHQLWVPCGQGHDAGHDLGGSASCLGHRGPEAEGCPLYMRVSLHPRAHCLGHRGPEAEGLRVSLHPRAPDAVYGQGD